MAFPADVEGAGKLTDPLKITTVLGVLISFVNPIFAATNFLEERHQSRYWHHLVIPPSIFSFTLPVLGVVEYIITAQGIQNAVWYLYLVTVYFKTSSAWMQLVS